MEQNFKHKKKLKKKRKIRAKLKIGVVTTRQVAPKYPELAALMKADEQWFDAHPNRNERLRKCLGSVEFLEDPAYDFAQLTQDFGTITHIIILKKGKLLEKQPMTQRMAEIFLEEYEKAKGYLYEDD